MTLAYKCHTTVILVLHCVCVCVYFWSRQFSISFSFALFLSLFPFTQPLRSLFLRISLAVGDWAAFIQLSPFADYITCCWGIMVRVWAGGDGVCLCVRAAQNSAGIIACTLVTFSLGDGRRLPLTLIPLTLSHTLKYLLYQFTFVSFRDKPSQIHLLVLWSVSLSGWYLW